jgi:hypothetical protein
VVSYCPDSNKPERYLFSTSILVPFQNNGWDCGVFVCRYAQSLFRLRDRKFSYADASDEGKLNCTFKRMITDSPEFDFGMNDISRLRKELMILIERLSHIYVPWKADHDRNEREVEAARKQRSQATDASADQEQPEKAIEAPDKQEPAKATEASEQQKTANATLDSDQPEPLPSMTPVDQAGKFDDADCLTDQSKLAELEECHPSENLAAKAPSVPDENEAPTNKNTMSGTELDPTAIQEQSPTNSIQGDKRATTGTPLKQSTDGSWGSTVYKTGLAGATQDEYPPVTESRFYSSSGDFAKNPHTGFAGAIQDEYPPVLEARYYSHSGCNGKSPGMERLLGNGRPRAAASSATNGDSWTPHAPAFGAALDYTGDDSGPAPMELEGSSSYTSMNSTENEMDIDSSLHEETNDGFIAMETSVTL